MSQALALPLVACVCVMYILSTPVATGQSLVVHDVKRLISAAESGDTKILQDLLAAGADVNAETPDGVTALLRASQHGHVDAVRILLMAGANPNAKAYRSGDYYRDITPLIGAALNGHTAVVQVLLSAGADPNAKVYPSDMSALLCAIQDSREAIVAALLDANADPNIAERHGLTALKLAQSYGSDGLVARLVKAGARECASVPSFARAKQILLPGEFIRGPVKTVELVEAHRSTLTTFDRKGAVTERRLYDGTGAVIDVSANRYDRCGNFVGSLGSRAVFHDSYDLVRREQTRTFYQRYANEYHFLGKTVTRYDSGGYIAETVAYPTNTAFWEKTVYLYDTKGDIHEEQTHDQSAALKKKARYTYDAERNVIEEEMTQSGTITENKVVVKKMVYKYSKYDTQGNWIERDVRECEAACAEMKRSTHRRTITYY